MKPRCSWVDLNDPLYIAYHDEEWAVLVYDDQKLFEFLVLESAQAGLSWKTILHKREGYRKAFKNFDPRKVAKMTDADVERLMSDASIVRNRLKIKSAINNAQHFLSVQMEYGTFSKYLWSWTEKSNIKDQKQTRNDLVPSKTPLSEAISKDMKKRGFNFLGPTVMYAFMQAVGIVNDHDQNCFRRNEM